MIARACRFIVLTIRHVQFVNIARTIAEYAYITSLRLCCLNPPRDLLYSFITYTFRSRSDRFLHVSVATR